MVSVSTLYGARRYLGTIRSIAPRRGEENRRLDHEAGQRAVVSHRLHHQM